MRFKSLMFSLLLLTSSCSVVVCDRVFPKLTWYWSREAINCRREHQMSADISRTNSITK